MIAFFEQRCDYSSIKLASYSCGPDFLVITKFMSAHATMPGQQKFFFCSLFVDRELCIFPFYSLFFLQGIEFLLSYKVKGI